MNKLSIDFYEYDTEQLEMLFESNLIEFEKKVSEDKTTIIVSKDTAKQLYENFAHLFDMFIMSLREGQEIKIGNKKIESLDDLKEFLD